MAVRALRAYLLATGALSTIVFLWLISPLPLVINRPLIENDTPVKSSAIVCLVSGSDRGLPSSSGWPRIQTSVSLFREGFAPVVIFAGTSGANARSEAEIYAEAAGWIGLPRAAARTETASRNTLEEAAWLLATDYGIPGLTASTPLLVVTSPYHGLRARLVFRKAGFTRVRIVTSRGPTHSPAHSESREQLASHMISRISSLLVAAREWGALAYYKAHGWI